MPRPYIEKLPYCPDSSLPMLERYLDESIPFAWHHHPEYELTLTLNSTGQRFVGDHVGDYSHGDLVLVGPNLPHTWSSRAKVNEAQPHVALVVWFRQSWIDGFIGGAVELNPIRRLFGRAAAGLSFGTDIGNALRERFESLFATDPATRLITVLGILLDLAERTHARTLSSVALPATGDSRSRIDRVLRHLHQDYVRPVRIGRLAEIAALSESGLHRMFVKHTRTTVSAYVARLRIGEACARLSGTDQPIARIAADVGYDNLANFNRQFRALRGMTPRDYRSSFRT